MSPATKASNARKGFASLSPARRRELAALGGKAAHARGTAFKWTPEQASAAGRKGGRKSRKPPVVDPEGDEAA